MPQGVSTFCVFVVIVGIEEGMESARVEPLTARPLAWNNIVRFVECTAPVAGIERGMRFSIQHGSIHTYGLYKVGWGFVVLGDGWKEFL